MVSKTEKNRIRMQNIKPDPVGDEILEYWSENEIGGSGMSISVQRMLKSMAQEIQYWRKQDEIPGTM